jgi:hypothetical protein
MPVSRNKFVLPSRWQLIMVLASVATVIGLLAPAAEAASYSGDIPFPPACGTCRMNGGERLLDSGWTLNMQGDGNLVMRNPSGTACFASNTNGHSGAHVSYQSDGNFVVYASSGGALWSSNTAGKWIGSQYDVSILSGYFYVGNTAIHGPC